MVYIIPAIICIAVVAFYLKGQKGRQTIQRLEEYQPEIANEAPPTATGRMRVQYALGMANKFKSAGAGAKGAKDNPKPTSESDKLPQLPPDPFESESPRTRSKFPY